MSNLNVTNVNGVDADSGKAKAWGKFDGADATLDDSFNVSSLIDLGTGNFTANWTNAFGSVDYAWQGACNFSFSASAGGWSVDGTVLSTAASLRTGTNGSSSDRGNTCFTGHGNLA